MKKYNTKQLNEDVDITMVAQAIGLRSKKTGKQIEYLCPNPEHGDVHFGSCKLTKDKKCIVCYACVGRNGGPKVWNPVSLVMDYCGYPFRDACAYLASLTGCPDKYTENVTPIKPKPILTQKEQDFLGIHNGKTVYVPVSLVDKNMYNARLPVGYRVEQHSVLREEEDIDEYILYRSSGWNPRIDDYDGYCQVIQNKAAEKIKNCHKMMAEIFSPSYGKYAYLHVVQRKFNISDEDILYALFETMQFAFRIYQKFEGHLKTPAEIWKESS